LRSRSPTEIVIEQKMYDDIWQAITAGRLPPGTKLGQRELATLYDVSQERVRKVLHRLGHEKRLILEPNRGAFVPMLEPGEAAALMEARRVVEAGIVTTLADRADRKYVKRLRAHVKEQRASHHSGDRQRSIRLAGEFHILLAEQLGNQNIVRILRDLIQRTSLIVYLYQPVMLPACEVDEHQALIDALAKGDRVAAVDAAVAHLSAIERRLQVGGVTGNGLDLDRALRPSERAAS